MDIKYYMREALKCAEIAASKNEVPVGAVIVDETGKVIAKAANQVEKKQDMTAHAEMLALKKAFLKKGEKKLPKCSIFITLEPCPMCLWAILLSGIRKIYYAAGDAKGGAVRSLDPLVHLRGLAQIDWGEGAKESQKMLQEFFKKLRQKAAK